MWSISYYPIIRIKKKKKNSKKEEPFWKRRIKSHINSLCKEFNLREFLLQVKNVGLFYYGYTRVKKYIKQL